MLPVMADPDDRSSDRSNDRFCQARRHNHLTTSEMPNSSVQQRFALSIDKQQRSNSKTAGTRTAHTDGRADGNFIYVRTN